MAPDCISLVTGACGFIGAQLVRTLVTRGDAVRALDDLSSCRNWHRLQELHGRIELIEGDVLDPTTVERAAHGVDVIFHFASLADNFLTRHSTMEYYAVNTGATIQLLDIARTAGVRRLIFASSCAVYGKNDGLPISEQVCPAPQNAYAASKLAAEHFVTLCAKQCGLETINLRLANAFGGCGNEALDAIAALAMTIRAVNASDNFSEVRANVEFDLCHVDDIVTAALLAANASRLSGEVINIGSGSSTTLLEIMTLAQYFHDQRLNRTTDVQAAAKFHACCLDIAAARKVLGYEPKVQFYELMKRTIARIALGRQKLN